MCLPALLLCYLGQASLLLAHPEHAGPSRSRPAPSLADARRFVGRGAAINARREGPPYAARQQGYRAFSPPRATRALALLFLVTPHGRAHASCRRPSA
ncbi:MAG: KUP/HAK/KT family potassium transporter [Polyangiaceae bacterium]|nr:KUP/HAK/KT family potassium transporter [Polyangiaceae bacterium]